MILARANRAASVVRTWFLTNGWVVAAASPFSGVEESGVVDGLLLAAVPIAVGIAVLRYRLYDIEPLRVVACNLSIATLFSREREARGEGRFPLFPLSSKMFRERPQEEMEELRLARERKRYRAVMYTNLGPGVVAHKDGALELTWRAGEGVGQVCALPRCTAPATTS